MILSILLIPRTRARTAPRIVLRSMLNVTLLAHQVTLFSRTRNFSLPRLLATSPFPMRFNVIFQRRRLQIWPSISYRLALMPLRKSQLSFRSQSRPQQLHSPLPILRFYRLDHQQQAKSAEPMHTPDARGYKLFRYWPRKAGITGRWRQNEKFKARTWARQGTAAKLIPDEELIRRTF